MTRCRSRSYLQAAKSRGHADAQFIVECRCTDDGRGRSRRLIPLQAVRWYRLAAEAGARRAGHVHRRCYVRPTEGVPAGRRGGGAVVSLWREQGYFRARTIDRRYVQPTARALVPRTIRRGGAVVSPIAMPSLGPPDALAFMPIAVALYDYGASVSVPMDDGRLKPSSDRAKVGRIIGAVGCPRRYHLTSACEPCPMATDKLPMSIKAVLGPMAVGLGSRIARCVVATMLCVPARVSRRAWR